MENIYTIKESLMFRTLYVQTVPQNIYQHKCLAVSDPQISSNPTLNVTK